MRKSLVIMKYMLAAVLLAMALVCSAKANTIDQVTFTVDITTGSKSGDTFTGSFTYDATTLATVGQAPLLSFIFIYPAWAGQSLSSPDLMDFGGVDDDSLAFGVPAELTGLTFFPPPVGAPDNAFIISGGGFIYGSTPMMGVDFTHNADGFGSVTYGTPGPVTTPEPSSLALILLGLGALLVMRKRMGRPAVHRLFETAYP
jgi:hypothetical protein